MVGYCTLDEEPVYLGGILTEVLPGFALVRWGGGAPRREVAEEISVPHPAGRRPGSAAAPVCARRCVPRVLVIAARLHLCWWLDRPSLTPRWIGHDAFCVIRDA